MQNFTFQNKTKTIFGRGTQQQVGEEIKQYSDKVLFHYGGGSIKKYGLYDEVVNSLEGSEVDYIELGGVQPNPRLDLIEEGIEICESNDIDFILAVGGGSVIDSAKAIAVGVPYDGDVWDFYATDKEPEEALSTGTILTIPATGSESSPASVITKEKGMYKRALRSNLLRPKFSILNPEITYTLPDFQTACGAVDIMSHVIERYFTNEKDVGFTDRLCEATLKTVKKNAPIVLEEPKNYGARAQIMWAGTIAHNDLLDTGREADWASHMIEHEISGIYDVTHGAGLSVILPAWMKYVYKNDIKRFAQFASRVWNVEIDFFSPEEVALEGIQRMEKFFEDIELPVRLSSLDIDDSRLEEMAQKCTEDGPVGNFVPLDEEDVLEIYKLAL